MCVCVLTCILQYIVHTCIPIHVYICIYPHYYVSMVICILSLQLTSSTVVVIIGHYIYVHRILKMVVVDMVVDIVVVCVVACVVVSVVGSVVVLIEGSIVFIVVMSHQHTGIGKLPPCGSGVWCAQEEECDRELL